MKIIHRQGVDTSIMKELAPTSVFEVSGNVYILPRPGAWIRGDQGAIYALDLGTCEMVQFAPETPVELIWDAELYI